jgi:hypothetical protein
MRTISACCFSVSLKLSEEVEVMGRACDPLVIMG